MFKSFLMKMLISLEKRIKCVSAKVLDIHVPIKETNVKFKHSAFMNKDLRIFIMIWACLLNKHRTDNNRGGNLFGYKINKRFA